MAQTYRAPSSTALDSGTQPMHGDCDGQYLNVCDLWLRNVKLRLDILLDIMKSWLP
jgi:hypothetical protein